MSKGDRKSVPLQQTLKRNVGAPRESHLTSWNPGNSRYGRPRESVTAQPVPVTDPGFVPVTYPCYAQSVPVASNPLNTDTPLKKVTATRRILTIVIVITVITLGESRGPSKEVDDKGNCASHGL